MMGSGWFQYTLVEPSGAVLKNIKNKVGTLRGLREFSK